MKGQFVGYYKVILPAGLAVACPGYNRLHPLNLGTYTQPSDKKSQTPEIHCTKADESGSEIFLFSVFERQKANQDSRIWF
ncbi:MAG: hypothetical protein MRZ73_03995 [Pseudoflavonifractor capillosus]|nr:hypothetical protein [Pseudoflavonifractor capillosus]